MTLEDLSELVSATKLSLDSLTSRELGMLESFASYSRMKLNAAVLEERRNNLQGYGGRLKDACSDEVLAVIAKCVEEEREACAKLVDEHDSDPASLRIKLAAAIRSRGEKR